MTPPTPALWTRYYSPSAAAVLVPLSFLSGDALSRISCLLVSVHCSVFVVLLPSVRWYAPTLSVSLYPVSHLFHFLSSGLSFAFDSFAVAIEKPDLDCRVHHEFWSRYIRYYYAERLRGHPNWNSGCSVARWIPTR